MSGTHFRKTSLDNISSPEQLNDYLKVSNPSIWMVLIALFVVVAAVLAWSITGSMPTTVQTKGVMMGESVLCYVDPEDADTINAGQKVRMETKNQDALNGTIVSVGTVPLSSAEITSELKSDYLAQKLTGGEYAVKITISPEDQAMTDGTLLNLSIVTETKRPIDFLLG